MSDVFGHALPPGLPVPVPDADGLSAPFHEGLTRNVLRIQRCGHCATWQWGPEWICHQCHSFDMGWEDTLPAGRVYAIQRVWYPVHPALADACPYLTCLVELPAAGNVRVVGNLLGDPMRDIAIGTQVVGVFEHHPQAQPTFSLLQWRVAEPACN